MEGKNRVSLQRRAGQRRTERAAAAGGGGGLSASHDDVYARLGPTGAFSGPMVRSDSAIVRKHLQVLKKNPGAKEVYVALAGAALRRLPVQNRRQLEKLLRSAS